MLRKKYVHVLTVSSFRINTGLSGSRYLLYTLSSTKYSYHIGLNGSLCVCILSLTLTTLCQLLTVISRLILCSCVFAPHLAETSSASRLCFLLTNLPVLLHAGSSKPCLPACPSSGLPTYPTTSLGILPALQPERIITNKHFASWCSVSGLCIWVYWKLNPKSDELVKLCLAKPNMYGIITGLKQLASILSYWLFRHTSSISHSSRHVYALKVQFIKYGKKCKGYSKNGLGQHINRVTICCSLLAILGCS